MAAAMASILASFRALRDRNSCRPALLAGLRARDFRVDADVVQRAGNDCHRDCARLGAIRARAVVVVTLTGCDGADDQPHDDYCRSDTHYCLQVLCRCDELRDDRLRSCAFHVPSRPPPEFPARRDRGPRRGQESSLTPWTVTAWPRAMIQGHRHQDAGAAAW